MMPSFQPPAACATGSPSSMVSRYVPNTAGGSPLPDLLLPAMRTHGTVRTADGTRSPTSSTGAGSAAPAARRPGQQPPLVGRRPPRLRGLTGRQPRLARDRRQRGRTGGLHYPVPGRRRRRRSSTPLGIETLDVYGTSMGGRVAQWLAVDHPDRVRRLVLGCTTPGGPTRRGAQPGRAPPPGRPRPGRGARGGRRPHVHAHMARRPSRPLRHARRPGHLRRERPPAPARQRPARRL